MIGGVKQQKWWGWGIEGRSYSYADKPKFPGFVKQVIGVDITKPAAGVPDFSAMDVPESRLTPHTEGGIGSYPR